MARKTPTAGQDVQPMVKVNPVAKEFLADTSKKL